MSHGDSAPETAAPSESLPGHLPPPDAGLVGAIQALHARGDRLDVQDENGGQLTLRCDAALHPRSIGAVTLTHSDGDILFVQTLARNEPALGDLSWQDLTGEARLLAWALAHEKVLAALSNALGRKLLPAAFVRHHAAIDRQWLTLEFDDAIQDARWEGILGLDAAAMRALAANDAWRFDEAAAAARRERIAFTCEVHAPAPRLALTVLRSLAPGDVLMLGMRSDTLASLCIVIPADPAQQIESMIWGAKWSDGALTLTRHLANDAGMAEQQSDNAAAKNPDAAGASPLDMLPVNVEMIIATPRLTLGQIERLAPGECLPLQQPLDHATVRLRVNGAAFARGELVALGDTLGVRIVSIDDSG